MGFLLCKSDKEAEKPKEAERPKLSPEEKAILDCKQSRDKIKAYIKRLEINEKNKKESAKDFLKKKDKDKAKILLSQSKMFKIQRESSENQLTAIEEQINRIDAAKTNKEVFSVLEKTNKVLKDLQQEVNIEKLEKISEDLNDIKQNNDEMTNFFKNHNVDVVENEDEINKEMEKLMKAEAFEIKDELPEARKDLSEGNKIIEQSKIKNQEEQKVMIEA